MQYIKTYRPIHVNVDSDLLLRLDQYKGYYTPRSKLIHEAIKHYLVMLEEANIPKTNWST